MLSSLRHPNIINFIGWSRIEEKEIDSVDTKGKDKIKDSESSDFLSASTGISSLSSLVMVTEYMGGGTLDHVIKQSYSFLASNFVVIHNIIVDMLCGLTYLHERMILHR